MLREIKKVRLCKIWRNETYDFAPWLAENLEQIREAIGIEPEFDSKEVSVDSFSVDILTKIWLPINLR
ncbi:hypothetical protein [uncultured Croceitalea sp.]|uniref:hypothetical protein n=1 Tax=uncultured Croceitalea sp. TaxID=1798908 RepID=UPI00374F0399